VKKTVTNAFGTNLAAALSVVSVPAAGTVTWGGSTDANWKGTADGSHSVTIDPAKPTGFYRLAHS
jgi:hypothetical protein